jgi:hypothetical protein
MTPLLTITILSFVAGSIVTATVTAAAYHNLVGKSEGRR